MSCMRRAQSFRAVLIASLVAPALGAQTPAPPATPEKAPPPAASDATGAGSAGRADPLEAAGATTPPGDDVSGTSKVETAPEANPGAVAAVPSLVAPEQNKEVEEDLEGLEKIRRTYQEARKRLGGEHVLLTATAYASRTCSNGVAFYFDDKCTKAEWSGGVAGLVGLPLWGLGGGHGSDWYPVLHTEDETKAFEDFERRVRDLVNTSPNLEAVLNGTANFEVSDATKARLVRELLDTVEAVTRRAINDDASFYEAAKLLNGCVRELLRYSDGDREGEATFTPTNATAVSRINDGNLVEQCKGALQGLNGLELKERIKRARELVRTYFKELKVQEDGGSLSRHNFLIGPAVGFPVTENPTNIALWGVAAEAGVRDSLRLGAAAGFVAAYETPLAPMQGMFVGLSLSGEYGDDLVHFISKAAH